MYCNSTPSKTGITYNRVHSNMLCTTEIIVNIYHLE